MNEVHNLEIVLIKNTSNSYSFKLNVTVLYVSEVRFSKLFIYSANAISLYNKQLIDKAVANSHSTKHFISKAVYKSSSFIFFILKAIAKGTTIIFLISRTS